jgi:hypothetical protein
VVVPGDIGSDLEAALAEMVRTADTLPGVFQPEFSLTYWAGVVEPADAWCCVVEGDLEGEDGGIFTVLGPTAADALRRAAAETLRRVARES